MRILHVMPHYFPAVRYGGPIRSVQGLAAATAALGHDVHVYATNVDGAGVCDVPIDTPVDLDGVKVRYFPSGRGRKIFRSPQMGRVLDKTISSFDVVHIHYVWVWTTVRAAAAARKHSIPYVLAPRGMLVADLIRRRSSPAKKAWLALFGRRDVAGAAAIHVTSDVEASQLASLGLSTHRVAVIPNGVNVNEMLPDGASTSETAHPYILFLGRISWKKGLDRLIRAFPAVGDADLVIAGYDEDGHQAIVERLAETSGIRDRIKFVGPAEGNAKARLIGGASCLVLPSYNENFGMVVVEAMAAGRPVVVTPEVGLAEMIERSRCGIVAGRSTASLAAALNYLLTNPIDARAMGVAGRQTALAHYSWPAIARNMTLLYENLVLPLKSDPP